MVVTSASAAVRLIARQGSGLRQRFVQLMPRFRRRKKADVCSMPHQKIRYTDEAIELVLLVEMHQSVFKEVGFGCC